jgi:methylmalonyl-CoA mutase N-terminal domain/subunit
VANVADPLGGSWFVEQLTDEVERQAEEIFAHLLALGSGSILAGVLGGIESGWFQSEIAESAYQLERRLAEGRRIVVGVNAYTEGDEGPPSILSIGPECEELQRKRLDQVRRSRDDEGVRWALDQLSRAAASAEANLMPAIIEAARVRATLGEMVSALKAVFGTWTESPSI